MRWAWHWAISSWAYFFWLPTALASCWCVSGAVRPSVFTTTRVGFHLSMIRCIIWAVVAVKERVRSLTFTFYPTTLKKRLLSFRYAFQGLNDLFRSQPNARIHALAGVAAIGLGAFFQITKLEWAVVVVCIVLVISLEAMNTAVEHLTDLVSPDYHPLAGRAKDVAAAAVLIGALGAAVVGALIFFPKIVALL